MIGENLRRILAERKMTVNALAEKMGVTRQTVHNWMRGRLTVFTLLRLAAAVGVEPAELLTT